MYENKKLIYYISLFETSNIFNTIIFVFNVINYLGFLFTFLRFLIFNNDFKTKKYQLFDYSHFVIP